MKRCKKFLLLLSACAGFLITGCATTEENMSERPWNSPKSWETGMPTGMMQGR